MDTGLLLARLVFGGVMAAHGAQKLFGWFGGYGIAGTGGYFESIGFRPGRFFAAAGATGGHDADDRLVYNTSNGVLYYDADGSGAGAAQVVATFQGGVSISAADITVI